MNIQTENSIAIRITKDEVMTILLDHIKRVAGGVVKKDMELIDTDGECSNMTFVWSGSREKEIT